MLASVNQTLNSQNDNNKPPVIMTSSTLKGYLKALKKQNDNKEKNDNKVSYLNVIQSAVYNKPLDERNKKVTDELNDISEGINIVSKNQESESKTFVNEQRNTLRIIDILQQTYDLLAMTAKNNFRNIEIQREAEAKARDRNQGEGPSNFRRSRIPSRRSFDMFSIAFSNLPAIRGMTNIMSGLRLLAVPFQRLGDMVGKGSLSAFKLLPKNFGVFKEGIIKLSSVFTKTGLKGLLKTVFSKDGLKSLPGIFLKMFKIFLPLKGLLKILLKGGVIIAVAVSLFEALPKIFEGFSDAAKIIIKSFTKNILPAVTSLIKFLSSGEGDGLLTKLFKVIIPALLKTIAKLIDSFFTFLSEEINRILGLFGYGKYGKEGFLKNLLGIIIAPANLIIDWFSDLGDLVGDKLSKAWDFVKDKFERLIYKITHPGGHKYDPPDYNVFKRHGNVYSSKDVLGVAGDNIAKKTYEEFKKMRGSPFFVEKKKSNNENIDYNTFKEHTQNYKSNKKGFFGIDYKLPVIPDYKKFSENIKNLPKIVGNVYAGFIKDHPEISGNIEQNSKYIKSIISGFIKEHPEISSSKKDTERLLKILGTKIDKNLPTEQQIKKMYKNVVENKQTKDILDKAVDIQNKTMAIIAHGFRGRGQFNTTGSAATQTRSNAESRVRGRVSTTPKTNPHTNNVYGFGFGTP